MTSSPALVTPPSGPSTGVAAASRRAVAHFSRASTSAGPAVSSRTSSTPQSADSATRPPPARRQRGEPPRGEGGDAGEVHAGGGQQAAQRPCLDQVVAGVDEDDVAGV